MPRKRGKKQKQNKKQKKGNKALADRIKKQQADKLKLREQQRLAELQHFMNEYVLDLIEQSFTKREQMIREKKRQVKYDKIQKLKAEGNYKTRRELERERMEVIKREQMGLNAEKLLAAQSSGRKVRGRRKKKRYNQPKQNKVEESEKQKQETEQTKQEQQKKVDEEEDLFAAFDNDSDGGDGGNQKTQAKEETKEVDQKVKVEKKVKEVVKEVVTDKVKEEVKEDVKKDVVQQKKIVQKQKVPAKQQQKPQQKTPKKQEKKIHFKYRNPVCCILGHVDSGKTSILDKVRNTSVQEKEAGGITQQIGATLIPYKNLVKEIRKVQSFYDVKIKIPGFLVIDTPGHESFSNLRARGTSLCDVAVLVIDIHRGVQKQTIESIGLLQAGNIPVVIALNKIDRLFEWKTTENSSSYVSFKKQSKACQQIFEQKVEGIQTQLQEHSINSELFYKKELSFGEQDVALVPVSAWTGEGIADLLATMTNMSMFHLKKKLKIKEKFRAAVLECNKQEGLGATVDIVLVSGTLTVGDRIAVLGFDGPIFTTVKGIYVPEELQQIQIGQNQYKLLKQVKGSIGIKLAAEGLEKAVAGTALYRIKKEEDEDAISSKLSDELVRIRKSIKHQKFGVCVQASTLGAMEALIKYLNMKRVPVAHIGIGPITKAVAMKAIRPLLNLEGQKLKMEWATILAFNVKILPEAADMCREKGVKVIMKDVIYHLTDAFKEYCDEVLIKRKLEEGKGANFPCKLQTLAFFNKKAPLVIGARVRKGQVRIGSILCINPEIKKSPKGEVIILGTVVSMEIGSEHKKVQICKNSTGDTAMKLDSDPKLVAGRHFAEDDEIISFQSRDTFDKLIPLFLDELTKEDKMLLRELKKIFNIKKG